MNRTSRKILYSLFTIFLAVSAVFFALRLSPGDPVERILGPDASQVEIEKYRDQLGLAKPVLKQYGEYLFGFFKGDLGVSLFKKKPVMDLMKDHFSPTLTLALVSVLFSTIIGIFLGVVSAVKKSSNFDYGLRFITLIALSFPIFSLAPLLVLALAVKVNIFPVSEWGELKHVFLPILTLVIPLSSVLARVSRNKYLEETHGPWTTALESKGMSDYQVILRIVKVCLPSIFNVVAIQLSVVLAGTMITETIFDIPGMGSLLFESIQNRDYPLVQGIIVYSTIIYMLVYFAVDIVNEYLDPRIES